MNTFKLILAGLVGLYLFLGLLIYLFQERLIFLPETLPADFEYQFDTPFDEHFINMQDGAVINALHFQNLNSKGLIVYFHGNAGSLERWGEVVKPFVDMGYKVLICDYRGYGKSTGKRSKEKLLSDAEAIYAFAQKLEAEDRIILFGRSLGCSFASYLGGKQRPSKVILETPFYSLCDVAKDLLPIYPTTFLLKFNFKNYQSLKTASAPIYIFHGTEDEVVPYESGQKLYSSIAKERTQFITIEGGHHNDLSSFDEYWEAMNNILNE